MKTDPESATLPDLWPTHPAADLLPLLCDEEMEVLAADIKAHGLREPVLLYDDAELGTVLLDGRNRAHACQLAGVPIRTSVYEGDDPVGLVLSMNLNRRHLTVGQKAAIADDAFDLYAVEAKRRQGQRTDLHPYDLQADLPECSPRERESSERAGKTVGVSGRSVRKFRRIKAKAPDLISKIRSGELPLDRAEKEVTRRVAREHEMAARSYRLSEIEATVEGSGYRLLEGDFRDRLADFPEASLDAVVTDPPHNEDSLALWSDLANHAYRLLKPQGLLIVLTPVLYLDEVIHRLGEQLKYGWMESQPMPGQNSRILCRRIFQTHKPWLVYTKGPWPSRDISWHEDTTPQSTQRQSFRWAQDGAPAAYLIENLTMPGAVICDPMTAEGTYGEVALRLGREFVGVEKDAGRFAVAAERLAHCQEASA